MVWRRKKGKQDEATASSRRGSEKEARRATVPFLAPEHVIEAVPLYDGPELHELATEAKPQVPGERRKILVVAKGDTFDSEEVDYTINLAARLGCEIVALNVGVPPAQSGKLFGLYGKHWRESFKRRATHAAAGLHTRAARHGVTCRHLVKFGELNKAVEEINHEMKRIDFVIMEPNVKKGEVTAQVTLPVFSLRRYQGYQGGKIMAKELRKKRTNHLPYAIGLGALSACLYAAVFLNATTVTTYFTKGGLYAALPVATALIFSFVHGSFTSNFLSALGIEPSAKATQPRPAARRPVRRERPRPRVRLNA